MTTVTASLWRVQMLRENLKQSGKSDKEGQVLKKSYSPEPIIQLLRQAEVKPAGGNKTGEV